MNEGYSFEPEEQFSWKSHQLNEEHYQKIKSGLLSVKSLCNSAVKVEDSEDAIFLGAMGDVLGSLERTLTHHFETRTGHIVSPKSDEPWD